MEDRLVTQQADGGGRMRGHSDVDHDENEEEKVYYGFGVFMGLPLTDLRAMKEEYEQSQRAIVRGGSGSGNSGRSQGSRAPPSHAPRAITNGESGLRPPAVVAAQGPYAEYEMRDPMGRPHGLPHSGNGAGSYDRGAPMHPQDGSGPEGQRAAATLQRQYSSSSTVSMGRSDYGNANGNGNGDGHHSDGSDGSDGSYSGSKPHSLNFILH